MDTPVLRREIIIIFALSLEMPKKKTDLYFEIGMLLETTCQIMLLNHRMIHWKRK